MPNFVKPSGLANAYSRRTMAGAGDMILGRVARQCGKWVLTRSEIFKYMKVFVNINCVQVLYFCFKKLQLR